jgi:hypothetical protein
MAFSHRAAVTAVTLASFQATRSADQGTLLQWRTGYEANNLGFNLYREELGVRVRVNPSLIGGSALMGGPGTPMKAGFSYAWVDRTPIDPNATVTYWLEDVDLNGTRTLHGPIAGVAATWKAPKVGQAPLLKHLGKPADPKPTAEGSELYYNP